MRTRTKVGLGIGAVIVIAITLSAIQAGKDKGVEVNVEPVANRDLVAAVNASGWIRPNRRVDVQSDVMGRIIELNVEEGQAVRKDEVLLRIDPTNWQAALAQRQASLNQAQAQAAQARANYIQAQRNADRTRQLATVDTTLVSQQQLEDAETQLAVQRELMEAGQHGVELARAGVKEAQNALDKTVIRAPMNGTITRLEVEEGETAIVGTMNNSGSLLLTVADLSTMETVVRVDETDVPAIEVGDSADITIDAFPKQHFVGVVTEIAHSSVRSPEQMTGTTGAGGGQAVDFEVVIRLEDPPPGLRPDLSATADIVTDRRFGALSIPIIALTVREKGDVEALPQEDEAARAAAEAAGADNDVEGVFVIRDGKAAFVPVQVGIAGREHFEVLSGVSAGDSIIAGPYEAIRSLRQGDLVRILDPNEATTRGTGREPGSN
ncbi:MAG: efflux RND transporter periplasmic adaptor subunit [Gemmatimonadota bacterium]|jgi:HlyD family secretion protein